MALILNTNIDAVTAQSALTVSGQKKSIASQRLGTGFRINTAKDDAAGLSISDDDVSSTSTLDDLARIDSAIGQVNSLRANLGAVQKRFTSITTSFDSAIDNTAAALSSVKDADYAVETTAFSSANVLQQAGISVLAEANQTPEQILKLLPN